MRPVLVRHHRAQLNCVRLGAGPLRGDGTEVAAVATGQRKVNGVVLGLCCGVPRAHVLTAGPMGCIWRLQG
eukprot:6790806-Heterocapsa_arctica.AAC.1